jgi:hypothetical protein
LVQEISSKLVNADFVRLRLRPLSPQRGGEVKDRIALADP